MKKTFNTLVFSLVLSSLVGQSSTYLTNGNLRSQFGPGGATEPTSGAFLEFKDGDDWISLVYEIVASGLQASTCYVGKVSARCSHKNYS
jgi:hypothetical protein